MILDSKMGVVGVTLLTSATMAFGIPKAMEALEGEPNTEAEELADVNYCASQLGKTARTASEVPSACSAYSFGYTETEVVTVEDFRDQYSGEKTHTKVFNLPSAEEFLASEIPNVETDEERKATISRTTLGLTVVFTPVLGSLLWYSYRINKKQQKSE